MVPLIASRIINVSKMIVHFEVFSRVVAVIFELMFSSCQVLFTPIN